VAEFYRWGHGETTLTMSIYLMKDGQQTGPHDEAVVAGWIATGQCSLQDPPSSSGAGTGFFMWLIVALAQSAFIIGISVFGGLGAWGLMGSSRKV